MASDPNDIPLFAQIMAGALTLGGTIGGIVWRYLSTLKKETTDSHVILERAEIADMSAMRELAREFKPALEKLIHIDQMNGQMYAQLERLINKIDQMDRDAEIAKGIREGLARRQDELEREQRRIERERDRS